MLVVLLSSATCLVSGVGAGGIVLVASLVGLAAVLAFSAWTGRDHLSERRAAARDRCTAPTRSTQIRT
jgi:hypothetical protein